MDKIDLFEVPDNLKDYLIVSDCSDFPIDSYFITKEMNELIEDITRIKEKSDIIQDIMGYSYPNTILLWGPPGTGKTSISKWLAYNFGIPFVYIDFSKIFNGIFGKTTGIVRDIFEFMLDRDVIFMLDEIDTISQERGTEGAATGGELGRVTAALMQGLDMTRAARSHTIIIGATNKYNSLDKALLSRFSIKKRLEGLTIDEEVEFILKFLDTANRKLDEGGFQMMQYDIKNIKEYCRIYNQSVTQRNVEMDIIRCIAQWIDEPEQPYSLNHVKED